MTEKKRGSWLITFRTPFGSMRKISIGGGEKLSSLAETVLEAYALVRDRSYFFFMSTKPWDGEVYTDSLELPAELSAYKNRVSDCFTDKSRFIFQLGYDPEYFFRCTAVFSPSAGGAPCVTETKGDNASAFPLPEEGEAEPEGENTGVLPVTEESEPVYSDTAKLCDGYCSAFVSLYGIITFNKAIEFILGYEPSLSRSAIRKAFDELPREDKRSDYTITENEFVYTELCDYQTGEYFALKKAQRGKPYYLPPKKELLKYSDPLYFERGEQYKEAEKLLDFVSSDEISAESIYRMLAGGLSESEAVSVAVRILRLPNDSPEISVIENAAGKISKCVRHWYNRGVFVPS